MNEARRDALAEWLATSVDPCLRDSTMRRIGVGHSRAMFCVTASSGQRVVVRVEQGGVFGTASAEECRVMRSLHAAGYPVARILAEDPAGDVVGQPLFVMEFIDGVGQDSGPAPGNGADERALDQPTAAAFVDALARLHALDGSDFGFDIVPDSPSTATAGQVERWHRVCRAASSGPDPLIDEAAAWLTHHAPPLDRLAVVHGDAGPGNFVHRHGTVAAVTDWEFAHLGDPAEDFAFCLTMRGARTMPREAWLELFAERAGFELSETGWRYWEAFNLFKGACANRTCLDLFERGINPAPDMAIIGTALHQTFLRRLVEIVHR